MLAIGDGCDRREDRMARSGRVAMAREHANGEELENDQSHKATEQFRHIADE
jgi:hypothetical protein